MGILIFLLILMVSCFFGGIVIRTKSVFAGRKGPGIFQPLKDEWRLFRKGSIYSNTSSFIFQIAPTIYFVSILLAITMIPLGNHAGLISFKGDFVFFAYLLTIGKFFNIISALDTGNSLEGMGASREALYSMLAEPAFFILMASFALLTGHTSFQGIFGSLHFYTYISYAVGFLAAFVFVIIALIENSRMPVDDPKTHLELTMVHEVMILDNSGFDLGLLLHASNLKFAMYGAIISNFFLTPGSELYYTIPIFILTQVLFAVLVGFIESFMARFRMNHNPQYIFTLTSVTLLIFLGVMLMLGRIV
ncbi:respiratory chain complex I subunit 1 family protein [Arcticibacter eurypsychrophilus]|uniref:respiratory chain complex I subunit 1 family protein n=1 Tax=Arcticibacter eurypsychrophilus TaxID=1434752 RepID=UPI0021CDCD5A|nr:NADH-quinone oxidoreductase subunit H [Arcticibacter eurypsychrophilus]